MMVPLDVLLIHDSYICTAYHCLKNANKIAAVAGVNDITKRKEGQERTVDQSSFIKIGADPKMDIGLIKLKVPFIINENVRTVRFFKDFNMDFESPADIIGWGAIKLNTLPDKLQFVS
uniref:Peptidase S1 domain-containing protein n=1 Tax=Panagrolaimus superbus TaxID=310955 RepID=A0A914Y172_9BILA